MKTIRCQGEPELCQIAEAYLHFFAGDKVQIVQSHTIQRDTSLSVIAVLENDGIPTYRHEELSSDESPTSTDYRIHIESSKPQERPETAHLLVTPNPFRYFAESPTRDMHESCETIKKFVLKFIGRELLQQRYQQKNRPSTLAHQNEYDMGKRKSKKVTKKELKVWKTRLANLKKAYKKARKIKNEHRDEYRTQWKSVRKKLEPLKEKYHDARDETREHRERYLKAKREFELLTLARTDKSKPKKKGKKKKKVKTNKANRSQTKAKTAHRVSDGQPATPDNLKKIEGIGPKIEELLQAKNIYTFEQLANQSSADLRSILDEAGARFRMHNPETWSEQAKIAAAGDWEYLKSWQDRLKGGVDKPK